MQCFVKRCNILSLVSSYWSYWIQAKTLFHFSEAGPCNKHSESLVGIRAALWRAPIAFTTMVINDTDEKEVPNNKKKKRATFNLIKKQRPHEASETGDLLWSQLNVVKGFTHLIANTVYTRLFSLQITDFSMNSKTRRMPYRLSKLVSHGIN